MARGTKSKGARSRAKMRKDPLVPVEGDRVNAAVRASGMSVSEFARAIGEKQQTIDLLVRGITKRCRKSRLVKIASQAGGFVTPGWLSGAAFSAKALSGVGRLPDVPVSGRGPLPGATSLPPRADLETVRLARDVRGAARRDGLEIVTHYQLEPVLSLDFFRNALGKTADSMRIESSGRDKAQFAVHMGAALRLVLGPWFRGHQRLEAGVIEGVLKQLVTISKRASDLINLPPEVLHLVDQGIDEAIAGY